MLRSDKISRMELKVLFSEDPAFVIGKADKFLSSEPVLHNLILSILQSRKSQGDCYALRRGESCCRPARRPLYIVAGNFSPPTASAACLSAVKLRA
jgi:hypothetical protein